jgi:hypothetical protein
MKPRHCGIAPNIDFHFFIASTPVKSVQTLPIISNPRSVKNTDDLSHETPKVFGARPREKSFLRKSESVLTDFHEMKNRISKSGFIRLHRH